jgi:hypothetical protein
LNKKDVSVMGILKEGRKCIIMQGRDFGKKIIIEKIDSRFVYFKHEDKEGKIGITQVFPVE